MGIAVINNRVLKDCSVFATLSNDELDLIAAASSEKQYAAGTYVFREGQSADELLVLEEGKVVLQMALSCQPGKGLRRVSVDFVSPGEAFGWPTVLEPYIHNLAAICLEDARVVSLNGNHLRLFFRENPRVAYEVMKGLNRNIAARLENTARVLVSERLCNL